MDYENYIELYEAIYFFDKLKLSNEKNTLDISNNDIIKKTGQILVAAELAEEYKFTDIDGIQPEPFDKL